jgi:hypothetical protein
LVGELATLALKCVFYNYTGPRSLLYYLKGPKQHKENVRCGTWSVRKRSQRSRFIEETGRGNVDWIRLAQDKGRWLAVVNAFMNLLVYTILGIS